MKKKKKKKVESKISRQHLICREWRERYRSSEPGEVPVLPASSSWGIAQHFNIESVSV